MSHQVIWNRQSQYLSSLGLFSHQPMEKQIKMSQYYSPLRYPGGKSCIFPFVSNIFYENELIGINYAEPYAGGSGLALRLLFEGYVSSIYINDLDHSIYCFWSAILTQTDEFCNWLESVDVSVSNWLLQKEIYNKSEQATCLELAKATFFLNRTNISGVIKGGIIGGVNQNGKYKINARFNKTELIERIRKISLLKHRIHISNMDGVSFIKKLNKKKEEMFIYLDPPYVQKGADLYMNSYSKNDHKHLAKYVSKINKRWMVSYDNHEFILNLYANNEKICYKLSQCASNRVGDEILIFSPNIEYRKSIGRLKSPVLLNL